MTGKAEKEWLEEEIVFAREVAEKMNAALMAGLTEEVKYILNEAVIARLRGTWRVLEDKWIDVEGLTESERRLWKRLRKLLHTLDRAVIYFKVGKVDEAMETLSKYLARQGR